MNRAYCRRIGLDPLTYWSPSSRAQRSPREHRSDRKEDARLFMEWLVGRSLEQQKMLSSQEAGNVLLRLGFYDRHGRFQPDELRIRSVYQAFVESLRSEDLN